MIETLDDIIEDLANALGVYGSHREECVPPNNCCRVCWVSILRGRIIEAVKVDQEHGYDASLDKRTITHLLDEINKLKSASAVDAGAGSPASSHGDS